MAAKETPATRALRQARVPFELLEYAHDPKAEAYGLEAATALGLDPAAVFKTLDGMFAVAIYDSEIRTLTLARDGAGEKPLYYYRGDGFFAFASELRTRTRRCTSAAAAAGWRSPSRPPTSWP